MKACSACKKFYQERSMRCDNCGKELAEISFVQALQLTRQQSLEKQISSSDERPDAYREYLIRRYLRDDSLFLLYDISKNRLMHGRKLKRFLIQPVNLTAFFNIPWFVFNIISTNVFYMTYTDYCEHCCCKYIPGKHSQEECDYNIDYFSILDDILTGNIVNTKFIYEHQGAIKRKERKKSAYHDLFERHAEIEAFLDILSITSSMMLWVFIVVFISLPYIKALIQR